ncbi:MAG: hypothetical protein ACYTHM_25240, partial [Planctomycetota bacterium]
PSPPGEEPDSGISEKPVTPPVESPDITPYRPPDVDPEPPKEKDESEDRIVVNVLRGEVFILRDGERIPLDRGESGAIKGDMIRVGPGAKARVRTPEGITYTLGENSEFLVE